MNPKYKTLNYLAIAIWMIVFGIWMLIIVMGKHYTWINILLMALGIWFMCYCAWKEEEWFPPEPKEKNNNAKE